MREDEALPIALKRKSGRTGPLIVRKLCGKGGLAPGIARQFAEPDMDGWRIKNGKRGDATMGSGTRDIIRLT